MAWATAAAGRARSRTRVPASARIQIGCGVTNRERFVAAFEGRATDRPPFYEQAVASDVASRILGRPAFVGSTMLHYQQAVAWIQGPDAYSRFLDQMAQDTVDTSRALGFGALARPWLTGLPTRQVSEFEFLYGDPDRAWTVNRYDPEACTYGPVDRNPVPGWTGSESIAASVKALWQAAESWTESSRPDFVAQARQWIDLAGDDFEPLGQGAGLAVPLDEEWLAACAMAPDLVGEFLAAQAAVGVQQLDALAEMGIRVVWAGGDLADNHGPLYGPRFFRQHVLSALTTIVDHAHAQGLKYVFRSDGDLTSITGDLFGSAGIDGYGEIDVDAGMDIPGLQDRYPELTCWGNISCRVLREGTPDDVCRSVENLSRRLLSRGRWILGSANTILPGTPVENVMAMYEAANA